MAQAHENQAVDIAYALSNLSIAVSDHLALEHGLAHELFDQAMSTSKTGSAKRAELDISLIELRDDWLDYLCIWSQRAIELNRPGFIHETVTMLNRLQNRVMLESELFYSALLQTGVIEFRSF